MLHRVECNTRPRYRPPWPLKNPEGHAPKRPLRPTQALARKPHVVSPALADCVLILSRVRGSPDPLGPGMGVLRSQNSSTGGILSVEMYCDGACLRVVTRGRSRAIDQDVRRPMQKLVRVPPCAPTVVFDVDVRVLRLWNGGHVWRCWCG